eukprot:5878178-Amphidinium_carterae.1
MRQQQQHNGISNKKGKRNGGEEHGEIAEDLAWMATLSTPRMIMSCAINAHGSEARTHFPAYVRK